MKFYSFSNSSDQALEKFMKIGEDEVDFATHQLSQMMLLCDYEIILITPEFPMIDRLEGRIDASLISLLSKAWRETLAETQAIPAADNEWKRIKRIGRIALVGNFVGNIGQTRNKFNPRTTLWRSNESLLSKKFFIFLTGEDGRGIQSHDVRFLCNLWKIENNSLPVHASAVIRGEGVYLFTGASGAGKSTVAALSQLVGGLPLEVDQVSLRSIGSNIFTADAWGYNVENCSLPLIAIFSLNQASDNTLIPLKQSRVAHTLIQRHFEAMGMNLSADVIKKSFPLAAQIARSVPGYNLYFTKSPDFWKVIDEQFAH